MTSSPKQSHLTLKIHPTSTTINRSISFVAYSMSTLDKVLLHLEGLERGAPFYVSDLYALGSRGSVYSAMGELVRSGKVVRISRGMYAAPKPLPSAPDIIITTSPEEIAKLWAKKHQYRLASQGLEAAYKIGFQTQAPVRSVYWSDGPTREFVFGNATLCIRRVSSKKLKFAGHALGVILRAIYVTDADTIEMKDLQVAFKRLSIPGTEMEKILKQLCEEPLPKKWVGKLESFRELSIQGTTG